MGGGKVCGTLRQSVTKCGNRSGNPVARCVALRLPPETLTAASPSHSSVCPFTLQFCRKSSDLFSANQIRKKGQQTQQEGNHALWQKERNCVNGKVVEQSHFRFVHSHFGFCRKSSALPKKDRKFVAWAVLFPRHLFPQEWPLHFFRVSKRVDRYFVKLKCASPLFC